MACEAVPLGAVTVAREPLEECRDEWPDAECPDVLLEVVPEVLPEVVPEDVPEVVPEAVPPVWVALPIAAEVPRAPTMPRTARAAWSRLLRCMGVMPRPSPRRLCGCCERRESPVSVA